MMLAIETMIWMLGTKLSNRNKGVSANGAIAAVPTNIIPTTASANWRVRGVGCAVTTENQYSFDRPILGIAKPFVQIAGYTCSGGSGVGGLSHVAGAFFSERDRYALPVRVP